MFQLPDEIILEIGTGICYGNLVDGVFFGNGDGDMTDIVTEFQSIFCFVDKVKFVLNTNNSHY